MYTHIMLGDKMFHGVQIFQKLMDQGSKYYGVQIFRTGRIKIIVII